MQEKPQEIITDKIGVSPFQPFIHLQEEEKNYDIHIVGPLDNEEDDDIPSETCSEKPKITLLGSAPSFEPGSEEVRKLPVTPGCSGGSRRSLNAVPISSALQKYLPLPGSANSTKEIETPLQGFHAEMKSNSFPKQAQSQAKEEIQRNFTPIMSTFDSDDTPKISIVGCLISDPFKKLLNKK